MVQCIGNLDALPRDAAGVNLTNETYVIKISGKNLTEFYYKDEGGWFKVSSRGRKFPATAEQVLNHVLPALAGIRSKMSVEVIHYEDPEKRLLPESEG